LYPQTTYAQQGSSEMLGQNQSTEESNLGVGSLCDGNDIRMRFGVVLRPTNISSCVLQIEI
jgi:hypothetical protein